MPTCSLSFTTRRAQNTTDLRAAAAVRAAAYGHHIAPLATAFAAPDALDHAPGTTVLLCHDKESGEAIGTARLQHSTAGPLLLESSVLLPAWLARQPRVEVTRLAVRAGAHRLVKLMLMKAIWRSCLANDVRWMVIGARSDALIRDYLRLGFRDALDADTRVPLAHAGGLAHRILAFDVAGAQVAWAASGHPLYAFMVGTIHPDLQLGEALPLAA